MVNQPHIESDDSAAKDIMALLHEITFRKSSPKGQYSNLPHEYIMTSYGEEHLVLWFKMRELIATYGEDRPFFKSRKQWRYLDMPDGYTYWVMPDWVGPDWESKFDPTDNYVLNRMITK